MGETDRAALSAQPVCELFCHRDRAMLAAGAAYGNRQITLALGVESRQQTLLVQAFHTFPDEFTVLKTQSLIEQIGE